MKPLTPNTFVRVVFHSAMSIVLFGLAGCGSMSGLGGSSEYGCKAPEGVKCGSVSGNYANAIQNNLPSQRQGRQNMSSHDNEPVRANTKKMLTSGEMISHSTYTPMALRAQSRVLRMWSKPWEDTDGALHDQGYVYLQTDNGHWLIDHAQRKIRDAYTPVRPPLNVAASTAQPDAKAAAMRPAASPDSTPGNGIAKILDSIQDRSQSGAADDDK